MRSAHRRTPWALAAAGSVTLALTGLAQTPPPAPDKAIPEQVSSEKVSLDKTVAEIEVSPSVARLAEIKVELAWLGDHATFPCQLAARRVGGKLEIGGFVPDESLRKKAMDIARANCDLPVVDKILVHAGSAMTIAKASHEELSKAAGAVLGKTLAKHAEPFTFETDPSGEITITGLLPTWEDKLTVSRRLSQLPGCTCVVNHFRVRNQMSDGKLCNLVSLDGKLKVPAAVNAVADNTAPKPAMLIESVQRVEAPGTVPLLPTEAPSAVVQVPGQQTVPVVSGPGVAVQVGSVASKPVYHPAFVPSPVVNTPNSMPVVQSKPVVAPPVASHSIATPTVVVKKDTTPAPVSKPTVVANNSSNGGLNGTPMKLPAPVVLGSSSTKSSSTVANVVGSPALPSKPVTTTPVASAAPAKSAFNPFAMKLGNPAPKPTPSGSPIQLVGYEESVPVNKDATKVVSKPAPQPVVNKPASQPTANPYGGSPYGASPYGGSPYGGSPYGGSPYGGSPYANNAYGASTAATKPSPVNSRPAGVSANVAGNAYGQPSAVPASAPVVQPAPVVRPQPTPPAPQPTKPVAVSTPKVVNPPVQLVEVTPVMKAAMQPVTVTPAAPVSTPAPVPVKLESQGPALAVSTPAPAIVKIEKSVPVVPVSTPAPVQTKVENPVPAVLPSNVVNVASAPVVQPAPVKPTAASPVTPVSAKQVTPAAAPISTPEVQGFLFNRIEQAGEGKIRDLHITSTGSSSCVISLAVPTSMDGQKIGQKIINMPELVPYKVDLQVRVQP